MMDRVRASDGHEFDMWMEPAQGTARGAVVILQEIFGVTDQLKAVAARYAAQGFDVAIPALYDRQEPEAVVPFSDRERAFGLMKAADLPGVFLDIEAAVAHMAARGLKVAVIGFCWGGGLALKSAQAFDIVASVAFYGTNMTAYLEAPLKAPMLAHFGTQDDHTPQNYISNVLDIHPTMEAHMYDTGHAFANEMRPEAYDEGACALAHERTAGFLDKAFA